MFKRLVAVLLMLTFVLNSVYGVCFGTESAEKEWISFLVNGEYWDYMSDEDKQRFREVDIDYAIYDLNADGCPELLLQDTTEAPFYTTWIFVLQEGKVVLATRDHGYGMYRYSERLNLVVGSPETKPFSGCGTCPFYSLNGTELQSAFVLLTEGEKTYYVDDTDKYAISEEARSSYFADMIYFDFLPVTEISTEEIETSGSEQSDHTTEIVPPIDEKSLEIMEALNSLLVGVGCPTESEESNPAKWSDETVSSAIYGKLLWDYQYTMSSYLANTGLKEIGTNEDWRWHFNLDIIQTITRDAFGRDFPMDTKSEHIFVSNNELVISPATGESTLLKVQNFAEYGDTIVALGVAVHNNNANAVYLGQFEATFKKLPDSVYGYTLTSLKSIEENQSYDNLTATASSILKERTMTHYATNAIDGDLSTAWVEGVRGVGTNEWIQIASEDGAKLHVSAIELHLGYQKDQELLRQNGWPCKILIESENGSRQEAEFYTYDDTIVLDQPVVSTWLKITILEAKKGSLYDDTCISEIQLHGVDATSYYQEYLEVNPYEDDPVESNNSLVIYSDYSNLCVRKGSKITLSAGILSEGNLIDDVSGIVFQITDTSILKMVSTSIKDDCRCLTLKGLSEGTTTVVFNDSNTGDAVKVPITVYDDNYLSYTLNSVPTQHIEKYPTNIYNSNGLYVDSYKYAVNDDKTATVSFDVYNTNYTYGAVEVYDENGNMRDAVLIEKMTSSNSSIKEAVWDNIGYLVRDIIDGDLLSYRQESGFSKKTSVSVKIPKNGYIKISTDPENSLIVGLVNSVDGLMAMASMAGEIKKFDVNSKDFAKKLTMKLLTEKTCAELIKDGSNASKELWKNVGKETFFTSKSMGSFTDTITNNIDGLKLGSIISETAWEFGWSIGENVFTYFAGPAGVALNLIFTIGKAENFIIQQNDLIRSTGVGSIFIQNQGGGIRACQQIKVESENAFSSDTALQVFTVTLDSTLLSIIENMSPEIYEAITNGITYTYNISLVSNGDEVQPDGKVTVYIPIPKDFEALAYAGGFAGKLKIYRVEEDGTLTEMDIGIEDGCFVFTTDHFSLYTIVGYDFEEDISISNSENKIPVVIIVSVGVGVLLVLGLVIIKKKRKI